MSSGTRPDSAETLRKTGKASLRLVNLLILCTPWLILASSNIADAAMCIRKMFQNNMSLIYRFTKLDRFRSKNIK